MDQTMDKTTDQTMDQTMDTNMDETLAALDKNVKPAWPMPYFDNRSLVPSRGLPNYAGFHRNLGHRNGQFHGGWTLRFEIYMDMNALKPMDMGHMGKTIPSKKRPPNPID